MKIDKEIELIVEKKRVKNLNLRIRSDGTVRVSAPLTLSDEIIEKFLNQKKEWILKGIERVKKQKEKNEVKKDGVLYLGKRYNMEVIKSESEEVLLTEDKIKLYSFDTTEERVEKQIYQWYKEQAETIFYALLKRWSEKLKLDYEEVRIKRMKSKWGSCNYLKKVITLNLELIKKAPEIIEYVVVHELAHLKYPHHKKEFWNFVEEYIKEWKKLRERLRRDD